MTEKLSERVERLKGPDREIDAEIAVQVAGYQRDPHHPSMMIAPSGFRSGYFWPHYTADLNAAMSLVPEGWGKTLTEPSDGPISEAPCSAMVFNLFVPEPNRFTSASTSLPLALCAAALKARGL